MAKIPEFRKDPSDLLTPEEKKVGPAKRVLIGSLFVTLGLLTPSLYQPAVGASESQAVSQAQVSSTQDKLLLVRAEAVGKSSVMFHRSHYSHYSHRSHFSHFSGR